MPEAVVISAVTSADSIILQEIAVLGILSWEREPTAIEVEERAKNLEEEIVALDPGEKGIFVAKRSGAIVGFGRVVRDRNDASQWWLLGSVVHPNHRRQCIGSALARVCIAYAQERGAEIIRSETHLDNEASIRYHESIGFEKEGRFTAPDDDEKVSFSLRSENDLEGT